MICLVLVASLFRDPVILEVVLAIVAFAVQVVSAAVYTCGEKS